MFTYSKFLFWFFYGCLAALINCLLTVYATNSLWGDVEGGQDYSMWGRSMLAYAVLMTVTSVIIIHEARYHHWLMWTGMLVTVFMYFPLVTIAYNYEPGSQVSFNFFDFMFNPKAFFTWLLISSAVFLPFTMAKDIGTLLYPRYRDLLVQGSNEIDRIRM